MDILGAVLGVFAGTARAIACEEATEAGISEELRLFRLGNRNAGDELGGTGFVDGRKLLEYRQAKDLAKQTLIDSGADARVEILLEAVMIVDVPNIFNDTEIDRASRET